MYWSQEDNILFEFQVKLLLALNNRIYFFNWDQNYFFCHIYCNKKNIFQFKNLICNLSNFYYRIHLINVYFWYCILVKFTSFFDLLEMFFYSPWEKKFFAEDSTLFLESHFLFFKFCLSNAGLIRINVVYPSIGCLSSVK